VRSIPVTPETLEISRRVIWFEEPEKALADPIRFMAYAMTYGRHEDMRVLRRYVSDEEFRQALDHAPPGIIDPRSWAYWNLKMGRFPAPPMPKRRFHDAPTPRSTAGMSLEEREKAAVEGWLKLRAQQPPDDMEKMRRRAVDDWRAKHGRDRKQ
jgi:hypothetical protein